MAMGPGLESTSLSKSLGIHEPRSRWSGVGQEIGGGVFGDSSWDTCSEYGGLNPI
jgi:hypothetical protein